MPLQSHGEGGLKRLEEIVHCVLSVRGIEMDSVCVTVNTPSIGIDVVILCSVFFRARALSRGFELLKNADSDKNAVERKGIDRVVSFEDKPQTRRGPDKSCGIQCFYVESAALNPRERR